MSISFKLKPGKSKRPLPNDKQSNQVETVKELATTTPAERADAAREKKALQEQAKLDSAPQWFEREIKTFEQALRDLPDAPTEKDYEEVPIDEFSARIRRQLGISDAASGDVSIQPMRKLSSRFAGLGASDTTDKANEATLPMKRAKFQ